jgi:PIN domain nuclease of toxin-antitoxin system
MKLLLDTHVAIWLAGKHEKLSAKVKALLLDDANTLYISIVSAWEVAIKASIGKLPEFEGGVVAFLEEMEANPIVFVPVEKQYVAMVETLPFYHRDPFDRLLVATAKVEDMTILTADENVRKYDISWIW